MFWCKAWTISNVTGSLCALSTEWVSYPASGQLRPIGESCSEVAGQLHSGRFRLTGSDVQQKQVSCRSCDQLYSSCAKCCTPVGNTPGCTCMKMCPEKAGDCQQWGQSSFHHRVFLEHVFGSVSSNSLAVRVTRNSTSDLSCFPTVARLHSFAWIGSWKKNSSIFF